MKGRLVFNLELKKVEFTGLWHYSHSKFFLGSSSFFYGAKFDNIDQNQIINLNNSGQDELICSILSSSFRGYFLGEDNNGHLCYVKDYLKLRFYTKDSTICVNGYGHNQIGNFEVTGIFDKKEYALKLTKVYYSGFVH